MTFILISGKRNTGKTRVCNRVYRTIAKDPTFKNLDYTVNPAALVDLLAYLEKNGKHIVVNAVAGGDKSMGEFAKYLDGLAKKDVRPDIIVTTIRETNDTLDQMGHMLALLEAAADNRPNLEDYFNQHIAGKTPSAPASLGHHALMLHLEEKQADGTKEEQEKALEPYWDDCASKVERMLDLAIRFL